MKFEIITIFPGFFAGFFEHGIVRRAQAEGLVSVGVHDLRAFTHDRHRTVDDRPFGGGEGMVLKAEPLGEALESLGIEKEEKNRDQGSEIRDQKSPSAAWPWRLMATAAGVISIPNSALCTPSQRPHAK